MSDSSERREMNTHYWMVFSGDEADFEASRAGVPYMEDAYGERFLLLFTTREKAEAYLRQNFNTPEAHMSMLEGTPVSHLAPITAGRFSVALLSSEEIARLALEAGVDYLQRDILPGDTQEVIRIP
jgi:hypothetical protein